MSRLTLSRLQEIARYELGADPGGPLSVLELSAQAGVMLMNARPWAWAEDRSITIRPRAEITIEDATWTEATKTLTKTGAFTAYSHLSGDTVEIDSGTGATVGTYEVASKTSANAVVLGASIGSAADGQTDIAATFPNDQVEIPSGFPLLQITAYAAPDSLISRMEFTSPQSLLDIRGYPGYVGTTIGFWALLRHVRSPSGGSPIPRLDLWPRATGTEEAMVIYYRGGWLVPSTDEELLSIPDWLDPAYIEFFKAYVMGTEEPEGGSVDRRIVAVLQGPSFLNASQIDSTMQQSYGRMRGGWLDESGSPADRYAFPPPVVVGPT